jgi:hypothetical protein
VAAVSLALACGGEESQPPAGESPPAAGGGAATPPPSEQDTEMVIEDMYEWDASAGTPRDLAADAQECQGEVTTQGLSAVAQHIQCMQKKGWKTRQPAS